MPWPFGSSDDDDDEDVEEVNGLSFHWGGKNGGSHQLNIGNVRNSTFTIGNNDDEDD
jgi:hypothetical protein